jgi:hypothetical protein
VSPGLGWRRLTASATNSTTAGRAIQARCAAHRENPRHPFRNPNGAAGAPAATAPARYPAASRPTIATRAPCADRPESRRHHAGLPTTAPHRKATPGDSPLRRGSRRGAGTPAANGAGPAGDRPPTVRSVAVARCRASRVPRRSTTRALRYPPRPCSTCNTAARSRPATTRQDHHPFAENHPHGPIRPPAGTIMPRFVRLSRLWRSSCGAVGGCLWRACGRPRAADDSLCAVVFACGGLVGRDRGRAGRPAPLPFHRCGRARLRRWAMSRARLAPAVPRASLSDEAWRRY